MFDLAPVPTVFATALAVSIAATPAAGFLARRFDLLDRPNRRKGHLRPVPLLGGVAVYFAFLIGVLWMPQARALVTGSGILVGATWVSFLGLWDDRRSLPVSVKLAGQGVAALLLYGVGIQVRLPIAEWANLLLTLLWVIGITNALNLVDNMDGLAGGTGAVAAGYFLLFAAANGLPLLAVLAASVLGACLGFLLYNFNPARIFLGDSGSLFLGFVLAALGILLRFPSNVPTVTWMVPVLVLGLPILDTSLVCWSRLRRGKNPFTHPGQDHLSHRLVVLGLSQRHSVLALYLLAGLFGAVALVVSESRPTVAYSLATSVFLLAVPGLVWVEHKTAPLLSRSPREPSP